MDETQKTINDWSVATFGPRSALTTATRMNIEVAELLCDLGKQQKDPLLAQLLEASNAIAEALSIRANYLEAEGLLLRSCKPNGKECPDIQVVLYQVAERCSMDLPTCTNEKMRINRARNWRLTAGGRFQHT